MPLLPYVNRLEPVDDAAIWRYLDLRKFRDLIASEELYFRRADLFTDKSEGLPPEQYAMRVLGLDPYDIHDRVSLNNHLGSPAQHRESYYISCWYAAYVLGADFVRNSSFDPTRRFIRYNEASGYQVTTPTFRPILADDEPLKRQTNGHLLIVEWGDRLQSFLRARVSLFNEMTYVVRLCGRYTGLWIDVATGHLFDPFDHQITKLTNTRLIRPVGLRPR